jgi:DNA-binding response OmpR family regulator
MLQILIVEDHPVMGDMMRLIVAHMGHAVTLVDDGNKALHWVQQHPVDVVLLDLMLPELDGFAFCRAIRADRVLQRLYLVATTARDALLDEAKGRILEVDDYLQKPFGAADLRARVQVAEQVLQARQRDKSEHSPSE